MLRPQIEAGTLAVCAITVLETGWSARSADDHERNQRAVMDRLQFVYSTPRSERRALEVQRLLMARGHHRAVKLPELLVAAIAEVEGLSVIHHDADFDRIAEVTGQPVQWVVPAGSVA